MRAKHVLVITLSLGLAACASDVAPAGENPDLEAVEASLEEELLAVLEDAEARGASPEEARATLFERIAALRERYEAALAAQGDVGGTAAPLRDPSAHRDLVVVGDSVSSGGSADGRPGWVELMEARHVDRNVANLAVGGTTAMHWASERPDLIAALDAELARQPDTVFVLLGGNDVLTYEPFYDDGIADAGSLGRAVRGLLGVITHIRVRSPGSRIVMGTYYDLFDLKSALIPASHSISGLAGSQFRATSWNTIAVNLIIHAVAAIASAEVADAYGPFMNHAYGNIWLGGGNAPYFNPAVFDVHPNGAGHEALYGIVRDHLGY